MKRILPLVILAMIAEIIFTIWLGTVVFETKTIVVPDNAKIMYYPNDCSLYTKVYVEYPNKTKSYTVHHSQIDRIKKERRFSIERGPNGAVWIVLYIFFVLGLLVHLIHWICSLKCSKPNLKSGKTSWHPNCRNSCALCDFRCELYNSINAIELHTPNKFKQFWAKQ